MRATAPPTAVPGASHPVLARDLDGVRLLVLEGRSGSGKSTTIAALLDRHREFAGLSRTEISGSPVEWRGLRVATPLVVIDELTRLADVPRVIGLLAEGRRVICASHLPGAWLGRIGAPFGILRIATDRDPGAIARYLGTRGVRYTGAAIERFVRRFGATYTDADIILEHAGGNDFDRALSHFERRCSLRMTPRHRDTEVRVID